MGGREEFQRNGGRHREPETPKSGLGGGRFSDVGFGLGLGTRD